MRGLILNPARRCPACGEETMRGDMPFLLAPVEAVFGPRCSYRWCRRCRKTWLAIHTPRRNPTRRAATRPPHRRATREPLVPAAAPPPAPAERKLEIPALEGAWRAESGSLTWNLRLVQTGEGQLQGSGVLNGAGRTFELLVSGSQRAEGLELELECGGSVMPFQGRLTSEGILEGEIRVGDSLRPLSFQRHTEPWGPRAAAA